MSMFSKLYAKVMIKRFMVCAEHHIDWNNMVSEVIVDVWVICLV